MATIQVEVVSVEHAVYSGVAKFVALPGQEGELGILPGHVPLITRVKPGTVRIDTPEGEHEEIFIAGGILEVQPDRVMVMADVAERSKDLDEAKTQAAIAAAEKLREGASDGIDVALVQAHLSALAAQLAFIRKMRQ